VSDNIILGEINIQALLDTKKNFDENLDKVEDDLDRAGIIQYFEFCFELSWKILKKILKHKGEIVSNLGPRDVFRISARYDLLRDPELWFQFLEDRNLTSHTYKEATAEYVFSQLGSFKTELDDVVSRILSL
jgi:nucleotidyltransferase substrate binding protein (TIGR01987 family)